VKLIAAELEPVAYALRGDVRTRRGAMAPRAGFRLTLTADGGEVGHGEALPLPDAGTERLETCAAALQLLVRAFEGLDVEPSGLTGALCSVAPEAPAARCAFDTAVHELAARRAGCSVAALLGAPSGAVVAVNAMSGAGDAGAAAEAARSARKQGYGTLKLKVGGCAPDAELARVSAARSAGGSELVLRIDANGAWTADQALAVLEQLGLLELELVEQPVPARDLEGMRRLRREARVAIAADEALALAEGRAALLAGELASFAVLKPMVLGGLGPAAALASAARARGIPSIVTTTLEGPLGTAAALHLAAAVGARDRAHGLASVDSVDTAFPPMLQPHEGRLRVLPVLGFGNTVPP
jgi:L-Ala-D/L-Glu epimerase